MPSGASSKPITKTDRNIAAASRGHNSVTPLCIFLHRRFDVRGKIQLRDVSENHMATLTPATRMTGTAEDGAIHTPTESELHDLMTESANSASQGFDTKSALEIARIINHEDSKVAGAVKKALAGDCARYRCRSARSA